MSLNSMARHYFTALKLKWEELQEIPTIFAYTLNVSQRKFLDGDCNFYAELNAERSKLRRTPQSIHCLDPHFNADKFNFNNVNPLEIMLRIPYEDADIDLIINKSPLTVYHSLICPELKANVAQRLTLLGIKFSVNFLRYLDDSACRVGYNSPGALASVNHLHLHLIHVDENLYIDRAELTKLSGREIYRLSDDMPTEAICFIIGHDDSDDVVDTKLQQIFELTEWLCDQSMPHNIFMTHERLKQFENRLKIFIFARETYCNDKDTTCCNIGFCELAGFVPVGGKELFESLNENEVVAKIRKETGRAHERINDYLEQKSGNQTT